MEALQRLSEEFDFRSDAALNAVEPPRTLVIGAFGPTEYEAIRFAVRRGGERVAFAETLEQARFMIEQATRLHCVFLDLTLPSAEALINTLRADPRRYRVPIVGVVPLPSDRAYRAAHMMGIDDVVVRSYDGAFTRRTAALWDFDPGAEQLEPEARAVFVHPSASRRAVLGRFLRQAGFAVSFSDTVASLARHAGEKPALAFVHQDAQHDDARRLIASVRSALGAPKLPVIVLRRRHAVDGDWGGGLDGVGVIDENAPPDVLGYLANELLHERMRELRASPRLLYGAMCGFRVAGEAHMDFGLTYNLSREGLYVRTLDPAAVGTEMWLELRPPGRSQVVHLRGRVTWRAALGRPAAGAPPGFGVVLLPQACPPRDLELYREAYDQLRGEADERRLSALLPDESFDVAV